MFFKVFSFYISIKYCFINLQSVTNQSAVHSRQSAVALAKDIYHVSKKFSKDEFHSLTTR